MSEDANEKEPKGKDSKSAAQTDEILASGELVAVLAAVAEDLRLLAVLHGGELTREAVLDLQKGDFADNLALVMKSKLAGEALLVIDEGLALMDMSDKAQSEKTLDALAADFADIYLTHRLQASPCESPWLDDDKLVNGEPMFAVRNWYEKYGMEAENWRLRSDDHMSLQMLFIAHLLDGDKVQLGEAGQFMDEHILRWLDLFAQYISARCATPFYAGLAMFSYAYMDELRSLIENVTGQKRVRFDEQEEEGEPDAAPFAPGAEPGW